jgi:hypothetical protein
VAKAVLSRLNSTLLPGEDHYGKTYYQALKQAAGETVSDHLTGRREMIERMLPGWHKAGRPPNPPPLPLEMRLLNHRGQLGAGQLLGSWDKSYTPEEKAQRHAEAEERLAEDHPALVVLGQGGGEPLPEAVLGRMNRLFGHDFSHVRIHTDARAADVARLLGAKALAFGTHVYFGAGQFTPGTTAGDRLLSHELMHVLQRDQGRLPSIRGRGVQVSHPDDWSEREAEHAERAIESSTGILSAGQRAEPRDPTIERPAIDSAAIIAGQIVQGQTGVDVAGPPVRQPLTSIPTRMIARKRDSSYTEDSNLPQAADTRSGGKTLRLQFMAFIPSWLGMSFKDTRARKTQELSNQSTFDAEVAAVTGTWAPEPGQLLSDDYYFSTDNRGFGGGKHRLMMSATINSDDIGHLKSKGNLFTHHSDDSHRAWAEITGGWINPKVGHVKLLTKNAAAQGSEKTAVDTPTSSSKFAKSWASYPFKSTAPNIDISATWTFTKPSPTATTVDLKVEGEHNKFPFYEVLINGTSIYTFTSTSTGPGLLNLNSSKSFAASGTF